MPKENKEVAVRFLEKWSPSYAKGEKASLPAEYAEELRAAGHVEFVAAKRKPKPKPEPDPEPEPEEE